jgi:CRISPR-associated endonuclease Cas1 subtype II
MGWRTIIVNEHSKLSYQNNHLIFKSAFMTERIHLSEIDVLLLETTDITITTMLLTELTNANILVIFCDDKRLPISKLSRFYGKHDSSLQIPKQISWAEESKAIVWTEIIKQKIMNQSDYLSQLNYSEKANDLHKFCDGISLFDPSNREGHAARIYFNKLFGTKFSREMENDINAGLNYGYTLILSIFARDIVQTGCLTQLGLKHSNQFNDFNLASDIMEPFRPLVDKIVYQNRDSDFKMIKRQLFNLFTNTYQYNGKEMFLTNITSDYTKQTVKALNEGTNVPVFRV